MFTRFLVCPRFGSAGLNLRALAINVRFLFFPKGSKLRAIRADLITLLIFKPCHPVLSLDLERNPSLVFWETEAAH